MNFLRNVKVLLVFVVIYTCWYYFFNYFEFLRLQQLLLWSDINECTVGTNNCDAQATCSNTFGSYTCACNSGWTGRGENCTGMWK